MKRILLMRHSIAEHGSISVADEERNLTLEGIHHIKTQAAKLQQLKIIPDLIISSHALRALNTAKTLATELNSLNQIKVESFLYRDFTTQEFVNSVHKLPNSTETVLMVGHNPTISTLLHRLTGSNTLQFPPAAIAILKTGFNNWNLTSAGECHLEQYLLP